MWVSGLATHLDLEAAATADVTLLVHFAARMVLDQDVAVSLACGTCALAYHLYQLLRGDPDYRLT
jgi:hypothetical protein